MPDGYPQPVYLDATVISNFASTSSIKFLVHVIEDPRVVPAVRNEIEQGVEHGHEYLTSAVEAFGEGLSASDVPPEIEGGTAPRTTRSRRSRGIAWSGRRQRGPRY